jgi:hypothetical protein
MPTQFLRTGLFKLSGIDELNVLNGLNDFNRLPRAA